MKTQNRCRMLAWSASALALLASPAFAQMHPERISELEKQVELLTEQLGELQAELEDAKSDADVNEIRKDVEANTVAIQATQSATTFLDTTSVTHLSGYASADYVSVEDGPAAFRANFNPMFHFLYDDKILWEAELEVVVEENGNTEIGLEYTTVDWFLNDKLTLIAGKFLSPIGNFRQNLHRVTEGVSIHQTVSVGLAVHTPQSPFYSSLELIGAADQAVYKAKSAGRGRVFVYEAPPERG